MLGELEHRKKRDSIFCFFFFFYVNPVEEEVKGNVSVEGSSEETTMK